MRSIRPLKKEFEGMNCNKNRNTILHFLTKVEGSDLALKTCDVCF